MEARRLGPKPMPPTLQLPSWLSLAAATVVTLALAPPVQAASDPPFVESAAELGLDFVHFNGMSGGLYTAEITGSGVGLFDMDGDGDLDVFLGQGTPIDDVPLEQLTLPPPHPGPWSDRLFENRLSEGSLRFVDVTDAWGLSGQTRFNMGVATGDIDNDGRVDLYLTALGDNTLLRNTGEGFEDITQKAVANDRRWSVPASFFDMDGDGWLDLFVGNYHRFNQATRKTCYLPNGVPDYCGPTAQPPEPDRLLRNRGDGTFTDMTVRGGLSEHVGTALGSVAADFDGDGHLDLYVANDQMANQLWMGNGDGTFIEDALLRGVAFDQQGRAQASMGVVAQDLTGDGAVDLFMTHIEREYNTLYVNDGTGLFSDRTSRTGMTTGSWPMTGFGVASLDYDMDGHLDLFVANGAVHRIEAQIRAGSKHPLGMKNQLFRGTGGGAFEEVEAYVEAPPEEVSRAAAVGDLDNDGDLDLVVGNNNGPVRVLLNTVNPPADRWLGLRVLTASGRDAYGARVGVLSEEGAMSATRRVATDGSFASANDPRLVFQLDGVVPTVRVVWPGGAQEDFPSLQAGGYRVVREGAGRPVSPGR